MRRNSLRTTLYVKLFTVTALSISLSCAGQGSGASGSTETTATTAPTTTEKPRIFIPSEVTNGNIGGAAGADALCMNSAAKPATGVYKALIVDSGRRACQNSNCTSATENINWVLKPNKTYYRTDALTVIGTTNAAGIIIFPLQNTVSATANLAFTGLNSDWISNSAFTCNNWTSGDTGDQSAVGDLSSTGGASIFQQKLFCNLNAQLICVEQ